MISSIIFSLKIKQIEKNISLFKDSVCIFFSGNLPNLFFYYFIFVFFDKN